MHEINAAAEAITAAADPDANIIFGATINPDLEGEVIITVVATGFDASYFAKRAETPSRPTITEKSDLDVSSPKSSKQEEKTLSEIDMSLEDESGDDHADFTKETNLPNIWAIHDDEDKKSDDNHEDGEKDSKDSDHNVDKSDKDKSHEVVSSSLEEELEKPSFLRRLGRRKKHEDSEQDDPKGE